MKHKYITPLAVFTMASLLFITTGCEVATVVLQATGQTLRAAGSRGQADAKILTDIGSPGYQDTVVSINKSSIWIGNNTYRKEDYTISGNQLWSGDGPSVYNKVLCTLEDDQIWSGDGRSVYNELLCTIKGNEIWTGKGYYVTDEVILTVIRGKIWKGDNTMKQPLYQLKGDVSIERIALMVAAGVF